VVFTEAIGSIGTRCIARRGEDYLINQPAQFFSFLSLLFYSASRFPAVEGIEIVV
jgi:hypothetical protein